MPYIDYVTKADRSPSSCMTCGNINGPFVDLKLPEVRFATPNGIQHTEAWCYLCVGSEENPGCAVQVGRMTGLQVDVATLRELQEHCETLNQEIADLRAALAKKTIKVGDVIDLFGLERVTL